MRYWWVNQGKSFSVERASGILWTRMFDARGSRRVYWDALASVDVGDVVLHNVKGVIYALSLVECAAVEAPSPTRLHDEEWEHVPGHLVHARYFDSDDGVAIADLPESLIAEEPPEGPFRNSAIVKYGYFFPLSDSFGRFFVSTYGRHFGIS